MKIKHLAIISILALGLSCMSYAESGSNRGSHRIGVFGQTLISDMTNLSGGVGLHLFSWLRLSGQVGTLSGSSLGVSYKGDTKEYGGQLFLSSAPLALFVGASLHKLDITVLGTTVSFSGPGYYLGLDWVSGAGFNIGIKGGYASFTTTFGGSSFTVGGGIAGVYLGWYLL